MSALRNDGTVVVYKLQTRAAGYRSGQWFDANLDHFGYPEGFSASSDCWQQTGLTGTFDKAQALEGLTQLALRNPGREFRVAEQTISQKTVEVAAFCVAENMNGEGAASQPLAQGSPQ